MQQSCPVWRITAVIADDNFSVIRQLKFAFESVENIVGKGENTGYHDVFKFPLSQGYLITGLYGKDFQNPCVNYVTVWPHVF